MRMTLEQRRALRDKGEYLTSEWTRKQGRERYYKNRDRELKRSKKWRESNPERYKELTKDNYERYKGRYLCYSGHYSAMKRSRKAGNIQPELTKEERKQCIQIRRKARDMSDLFEEAYEVDHIIPISQGGLEHPSNLQILTAYEHRKKSQKETLDKTQTTTDITPDRYST